MGSFYDNIHLLTSDRTMVEHAWQSYWDGRGKPAWTWISPVYHGWVSVFDWQCDQQDVDTLNELAAHLCHAIDGVALAFQLQNSELAEYWLYQRGERKDYYTSNAEYFAKYAEQADVTPENGQYAGYGPDTKYGYATEEDLSDGGSTRLLKSLTGTAAAEMELDAILRSPAYVADDILTALASAIGINDTWASLGYHYLTKDGDNSVPAFEQFRHLPQNQPPNMQPSPER